LQSIQKNTVFLSIRYPRKKNIKKLGQKLSKLPAGKKITILLEFFEKQQELGNWKLENM